MYLKYPPFKPLEDDPMFYQHDGRWLKTNMNIANIHNSCSFTSRFKAFTLSSSA